MNSPLKPTLAAFLVAAIVFRGVLFPGYGGDLPQIFSVLIVFPVVVGTLCIGMTKAFSLFSPIRTLGFSVLSLSTAEALSVAVQYAKTGFHFGNDPTSLVMFFFIYMAQLWILAATVLLVWRVRTKRQRK